jgi:hypothetical protein
MSRWGVLSGGDFCAPGSMSRPATHLSGAPKN